MNKANVFLLVVVSSLLTYISTATQPAATAGVAQEKWEYGVSYFENNLDFLLFSFRSSDYTVIVKLDRRIGLFSNSIITPNGSDFEQDAFEASSKPGLGPMTLKVWLDIKEPEIKGKVSSTFASLGQEG